MLNIALNFNLILSSYKGIYQIDILPYIFGVDILPFAGITLIIIALLKKSIDWNIIVMPVLIIVSVLLSQFLLGATPENKLLKYISAFFYGSCKWSYFPFFPWLAYPLTGILFYKLQQRYSFNFLETTKKKIISGIVFLLFLIFTINYGISISAELPLYYHHDLLFFCWTIFFLCLYSFFINEINKLLAESILINYLKWLGENVTFIYVIQWIIIGNVATEVYRKISSPVDLTIAFILVLVVCSLVCYWWSRIKQKYIKHHFQKL